MAYSHHAPSMTGRRAHYERPGTLVMPRRRGTGTGTALVLLGIWGGIIPFIGPIFGYRVDTTPSWTFSWDRLWLNILPGAAVLIGGLILIGVADRLSATVGAALALAGGVWFLIGPSIGLLWGSPLATNGIGVGSDGQRMVEQIGYFYGLGAVVTALAAGTWARVLVRSERDAALLESAAADSAAGAGPTAEAADYPATAGPVPDYPADEAPGTVGDAPGYQRETYQRETAVRPAGSPDDREDRVRRSDPMADQASAPVAGSSAFDENSTAQDPAVQDPAAQDPTAPAGQRPVRREDPRAGDVDPRDVDPRDGR